MFKKIHFQSLANEPSSSALSPEDQQQMLETIGERPPLFLMKYIKAGMDKCRYYFIKLFSCRGFRKILACHTLMIHSHTFGFRKKDDERNRKSEDGNGEKKLDEKLCNITISEDISVLFSPAGNYKMRFTKGSGDLLIRAGAPRKGMDVSF